ncbi:bifunctional indole-3-glycerol-phosphate synthase TrpC/phosphoribosylanthranilate isomerase TrpF [Corynebacterium sp. SCR221107]|uniref:bifunctional indole-3-glycerol-phosphate synthase TrpC/phosphoribosylanthranilate isomerase TrpF n=1 Tax=Corynebacterium sp. SCR221107 TaxID=3017361 RepID=UPI0022EC5777|nr:bifunctional indole-3-glycerol-phosphate synthase TrpC/phosphoribosylanthranilate isomerase TrpF [Corynebacterium sp. SCR221107]WBT08760.1 bifunctional indole-3-glycerol-phosphate synthase TrpC/phosphoribosylanthranilate isomerase TrpF [Corynebacterium sp. SCR221107]
MGSNLPTVLEGIVSARRGHLQEIRERIAHVDVDKLEKSDRSLFENLYGHSNAFIMECKSASPSLGLIRGDYHPGDIARVYSRYAAGISVLCEPERFHGDYNHLATVRASTHLPVLCKDFIIDKVQIHAARYFGADAVLLMLSVLSDEEYAELAAEAERFGLDVLTEIIDEEELARATRLGAKIFGINHRNLHDLSIDLTRSGRLAALAPKGVAIVSESGIRDNATVRALGGHSNAFLVGSQLTGQPDIDRAARELVYGPNKVCGLRSGSAAQAARAAGAVYGGLVFEEVSPRNVSRETAQEIIAAEPGLKFVAVSRRTAGWEELAFDGISVLQIHAPYQGSLEAERALIASVRAVAGEREVWRAVSMSTTEDAALATALAEDVDKLILDAGNGGTGASFDWTLVPQEVKHKALLAGGLRADTVTDALGVGCVGLDLNSGLEYPADAGVSAGHKDAAQIQAAFNAIRTYVKNEK